MHKLKFLFILFTEVMLFPFWLHAQAQLTGREIVQKQVDINKGYHDEVSHGKMLIISQSGSQTVREFEFALLEETDQEGCKSLIKISKPADLQGTGVLSYQNKNRDDDQWLYLPALKKSKRISGSSKTGKFIGSEFTYEDLSPFDIEDFQYKYIKTEPCGSSQCDVVEAIPQYADSGYSKTINWISQDHTQNIKTDFYDKKGVYFKQALYEDYQFIDAKFWRPSQITIKNLLNNRQTQLTITDRAIKKSLSNAQFSKSALER